MFCYKLFAKLTFISYVKFVTKIDNRVYLKTLRYIIIITQYALNIIYYFLNQTDYENNKRRQLKLVKLALII